MTAFDALEQMWLDLTLAGTKQETRTPVVGLFKVVPVEAHNGRYGQFGEPEKSAVSTGYHRVPVVFSLAAPGGSYNTQAIAITGLSPGTYTHFGLFGSFSEGS